MDKGLKIAITGKGGVGKTTLAVLLSYTYSLENRKIFLIDSDPDQNSGISMGLNRKEIENIKPIAELQELITERTESKESGGFFKLNPEVSDIPDRFSVEKNGIKLLTFGTVKKGGTGCLCPENSFLKTLLQHLILNRDEVVILDMVAGIEHIGRATAQSVDSFIIVVEPSIKSISTAEKIINLIQDINIKKYYIVANKIRNESDIDFIKKSFDNDKFLGYLPFSEKILDIEKQHLSIFSQEIINVFLPYVSVIKKKI